MTRTALILGATGGIGGEIARQLLADGWQVRALSRKLPALENQYEIDWRIGDVMIAEDVLAAASGCDVIVHAVNPPGYRRWADLVLPMLDNTISAALVSGATIVLPGTVYNFGPDALPLVSETSAQQPRTRKGAIRVKLEQRLRLASRGGARVLIVRAGDFFGPSVQSSWLTQGIVTLDVAKKNGKKGATAVEANDVANPIAKRVSRISYPGAPGVGHQWAYVPDVARTIVTLLDRRETLDAFAQFNMGGHWDADGTRMIEAIRAVARQDGRSGDDREGTAAITKAPKVTRFPWWLLKIFAPFNETYREMGEMRYLWQLPLQLDNARLCAELGAEPHTPWEAAVAATLGLLRPETKPAAKQPVSNPHFQAATAAPEVTAQ